ncbi:Na+:H+ antiporter, NhaA family [Cryobacterium flavum]|uniref:Na(+)/H(+) antiporter NhaA n=1 Tax=Cryobacterium flavum TaxID=1424659 RepID=A0A4V6QGG5_9MICO|nr:Na+/H+ antiporter NhaA [Cryobacterium flavum]TFB81648.1 Na+/H+ antiporter NhaA [Cryobacterium flavum]SDN61377.1 Na+:H+ antiporter, NhaA family [Cryobacterium flavum]
MTEPSNLPTPPKSAPSTAIILRRGSHNEFVRISGILRKETVGGAILLAATVAALIMANSGFSDAYYAFRDYKIGYAPWHLELSLGAWAADGFLAIFFFLAGLELKREFVAGDLRSVNRAIVPVAAAVGGVIIPAVIYVLINLETGAETLRGWAIPTATDIAFALAVLAVIGSKLPPALRIFLLTLAVVDDLLAIAIIAFFYTTDMNVPLLLLAIVPLALFWVLTHKFSYFFGTRAWAAWTLLLPLGFIVWALVHGSGVHATVAGVLLGFAVPVLRSKRGGGPDAGPGLAETLEHRIRPLSSGFAIPVFAFFSAGVTIGGADGLYRALTDPVAIGIVVALVVGKPTGVLLATFIVTKTTKASLDPDLAWIDVIGVSLLAGVGFTVSLLISELAFGQGSPHDDHAKVAILVGSLLAALLATAILRSRNRHYGRIAEKEAIDSDNDGIPDVYQSEEAR